jgi:hypothetical protein
MGCLLFLRAVFPNFFHEGTPKIIFVSCVNEKWIRSIWKVLICGAGEEWRRSVGPIV